MSDFGLIDLGRVSEATTAASSFRTRPFEKTIAVDVGASSTKAEISRGGFALPEIAVLPEGIGSFLDDLVVVQTKVVTQTIVAGTAVAVGTAIDVVLAQTNDLPVAVIPGIHQAFAGATMAQVHQQFVDVPEVRDILRTKTSVSDLTADDVASLTTVLEGQGITLGTGSGETVGSAFTAIQAAFTFQG